MHHNVTSISIPFAVALKDCSNTIKYPVPSGMKILAEQLDQPQTVGLHFKTCIPLRVWCFTSTTDEKLGRLGPGWDTQ